MITMLDPSFEERPAPITPAPRPAGFVGATVGLLSNGKAGTRPFFDHLEHLLRRDWGVGEVVRVTKANYSAPAEAALIEQAAGWAVMFAGIGD